MLPLEFLFWWALENVHTFVNYHPNQDTQHGCYLEKFSCSPFQPTCFQAPKMTFVLSRVSDRRNDRVCVLCFWDLSVCCGCQCIIFLLLRHVLWWGWTTACVSSHLLSPVGGRCEHSRASILHFHAQCLSGPVAPLSSPVVATVSLFYVVICANGCVAELHSVLICVFP